MSYTPPQNIVIKVSNVKDCNGTFTLPFTDTSTNLTLSGFWSTTDNGVIYNINLGSWDKVTLEHIGDGFIEIIKNDLTVFYLPISLLHVFPKRRVLYQNPGDKLVEAWEAGFDVGAREESYVDFIRSLRPTHLWMPNNNMMVDLVEGRDIVHYETPYRYTDGYSLKLDYPQQDGQVPHKSDYLPLTGTNFSWPSDYFRGSSAFSWAGATISAWVKFDFTPYNNQNDTPIGGHLESAMFGLGERLSGPRMQISATRWYNPGQDYSREHFTWQYGSNSQTEPAHFRSRTLVLKTDISEEDKVPEEGRWYFVTVVKTLTHLKFYVDGQLLHETATNDNYQAARNIFYLGRPGNGTSFPASMSNGEIKFPTAFDRPLEEEEIQELYVRGSDSYDWTETNNFAIDPATTATQLINQNGTSFYVNNPQGDNFNLELDLHNFRDQMVIVKVMGPNDHEIAGFDYDPLPGETLSIQESITANGPGTYKVCIYNNNDSSQNSYIRKARFLVGEQELYWGWCSIFRGTSLPKGVDRTFYSYISPYQPAALEFFLGNNDYGTHFHYLDVKIVKEIEDGVYNEESPLFHLEHKNNKGYAQGFIRRSLTTSAIAGKTYVAKVKKRLNHELNDGTYYYSVIDDETNGYYLSELVDTDPEQYIPVINDNGVLRLSKPVYLEVQKFQDRGGEWARQNIGYYHHVNDQLEIDYYEVVSGSALLNTQQEDQVIAENADELVDESEGVESYVFYKTTFSFDVEPFRATMLNITSNDWYKTLKITVADRSSSNYWWNKPVLNFTGNSRMVLCPTRSFALAIQNGYKFKNIGASTPAIFFYDWQERAYDLLEELKLCRKAEKGEAIAENPELLGYEGFELNDELDTLPAIYDPIADDLTEDFKNDILRTRHYIWQFPMLKVRLKSGGREDDIRENWQNVDPDSPFFGAIGGWAVQARKSTNVATDLFRGLLEGDTNTLVSSRVGAFSEILGWEMDGLNPLYLNEKLANRVAASYLFFALQFYDNFQPLTSLSKYTRNWTHLTPNSYGGQAWNGSGYMFFYPYVYFGYPKAREAFQVLSLTNAKYAEIVQIMDTIYDHMLDATTTIFSSATNQYMHAFKLYGQHYQLTNKPRHLNHVNKYLDNRITVSDGNIEEAYGHDGNYSGLSYNELIDYTWDANETLRNKTQALIESGLNFWNHFLLPDPVTGDYFGSSNFSVREPSSSLGHTGFYGTAYHFTDKVLPFKTQIRLARDNKTVEEIWQDDIREKIKDNSFLGSDGYRAIVNDVMGGDLLIGEITGTSPTVINWTRGESSLLASKSYHYYVFEGPNQGQAGQLSTTSLKAIQMIFPSVDVGDIIHVTEGLTESGQHGGNGNGASYYVYGYGDRFLAEWNSNNISILDPARVTRLSKRARYNQKQLPVLNNGFFARSLDTVYWVRRPSYYFTMSLSRGDNRSEYMNRGRHRLRSRIGGISGLWVPEIGPTIRGFNWSQRASQGLAIYPTGAATTNNINDNDPIITESQNITDRTVSFNNRRLHFTSKMTDGDFDYSKTYRFLPNAIRVTVSITYNGEAATYEAGKIEETFPFLPLKQTDLNVQIFDNRFVFTRQGNPRVRQAVIFDSPVTLSRLDNIAHQKIGDDYGSTSVVNANPSCIILDLPTTLTKGVPLSYNYVIRTFSPKKNFKGVL